MSWNLFLLVDSFFVRMLVRLFEKNVTPLINLKFR